MKCHLHRNWFFWFAFFSLSHFVGCFLSLKQEMNLADSLHQFQFPYCETQAASKMITRPDQPVSRDARIHPHWIRQNFEFCHLIEFLCAPSIWVCASWNLRVFLLITVFFKRKISISFRKLQIGVCVFCVNFNSIQFLLSIFR